MRYNKTIAVSLAAMSIIIAGSLVVNAAGGGVRGLGNKKNFNLEKRQAAAEAVEAGDYTAWVEVIGEDNYPANEVTQEEFSTLVQSRELMKEC